MEWIGSRDQEKQQQQQQNEGEMMVAEGYMKVMTDEQMELLRKQIAVYTMISEQLVEMHKSCSAQYDIDALSLSMEPHNWLLKQEQAVLLEDKNENKAIMEWNSRTSGREKQQQNEGEMMMMMVVEGLYVKVMTDEQMELLRKQIAVYAMICEQLVEMHKSFSAQYEIAGMRLGNPYFDRFMSSGGQKITARHRWTPTPVQLQILERVYDECNGNPGKQKILEMTTELAQHGQISETNVYNWFQNRRARIKRKQSGETSNTAESEAEKHVLSKKTTPESIQSFENPATFQSPEIGMEQMIGKMDVAEILSQWQMEQHDMLG